MLRHPRSANQNGQDTETRRQPQQEDQRSTSVTSLEKGTLSGKYAIMCKYYYYCIAPKVCAAFYMRADSIITIEFHTGGFRGQCMVCILAHYGKIPRNPYR